VPRREVGVPYGTLTVKEAKEKVESGEAVLVDVRAPDEYRTVHAEPAGLLVPHMSVFNRLQEIKDYAGDREILFICKSGQRSALASEFAAAGGVDHEKLWNVEGGTDAWVEAGLPSVRG
jgi:rhodanese-related sulfurtransferase